MLTKKYLLTAFLIAISLGAFAQIGITAGMNLSKYSYAQKSAAVDRKAIMAYNFGLQYRKAISEKVYLLPELAYTVKGTNIYFTYPIGYTGPMKYNNHLNYLQLTLPAVATLPLSDELDYEIAAGLFTGYMISGRSKMQEFDGATSERKFDKDDFKKMDYGLQFSMGFRLARQFGLRFTYDLGLANIAAHSTDPAIKTRNFSISLSWQFSEND